jgi:hypothetical protein
MKEGFKTYIRHSFGYIIQLTVELHFQINKLRIIKCKFMKKIEWSDPKKKNEAYKQLMKMFNTSKCTVSLAMSFKRNSLTAAKMRYVAISELGGKQLVEDKEKVKSIKILDSKGNVVKCIEETVSRL